MSKYYVCLTVPVKGRRKPLANLRKKDYFCTVISEDVKLVLKNKTHISRILNHELFVQCNQSECQYVDHNQSPCPLRLDFFAKEIEMQEEKRKNRRMRF
jgi:hypothetical protein